jgi:chromosome segregation protein
LSEGETPLEIQEKDLAGKLEERSAVEAGLNEARRRLGDVDERLRELNTLRGERENTVDQARTALDAAKLAAQEIRVRGEALNEQLTETGFELELLQREMPEEATTGNWDEKLEKLRGRIGRLGPINLAAIDEFKEQSERKEYLDSQFEDLTQALDTLENAIRKIDKETRTRFRETYDKVNAGLKENFPRLFGGGHAYLELTGEDILEAGVTIMARPPGKRNSSIHLLSGGEKALTAVALVFAIFQLNPAPFCLLDEVDAPLDDANVGRYCEIVKEMSEKVQFVFITHNKVTMEMAHQLTGVTMQEPGVSRLVVVDVDEAVRMAAG